VPLLFLRGRRLHLFHPHEALHLLVPHCPSLPTQQAIGLATASADLLSCDFAEVTVELFFHDIYDFAGMALCAAVSPHHTANGVQKPGSAHPDSDGPAPAFRAQRFPSAWSLSIAFFSSASTRCFLSRAFPFPSWVNLMASLASIPPYYCLQQC